jgi:hypothetical protein
MSCERETPAAAPEESPVTTATDFVTLHTSEISTATMLLLSEQSVGRVSILDKLDRAAAVTTSRADLVRRAREAHSWCVRRLPMTDAAELVLDALRAVINAPEAAKIR